MAIFPPATSGTSGSNYNPPEADNSSKYSMYLRMFCLFSFTTNSTHTLLTTLYILSHANTALFFQQAMFTSIHNKHFPFQV